MYNSPNIIGVTTLRRMKWVEQLKHVGEWSSAYTVLVGKPEVKRLLGIPRCKWKDNIKMDFQEIGLWT